MKSNRERMAALAAKERRVVRRERDADAPIIENGHIYEKLRHHRHPRGRRSWIAPKEIA